MQNIQKILIALDFTKADQNLLNYTRYLAEITHAQEIHCVHVIKSNSGLAELDKTYQDHIKQPLEDQLEADIHGQLKEVFGNDSGLTHHVQILKGQPSPEVLKYSEKASIDLIVVGEKEDPDSSGIVASRLSRRAHCSVLYVPDSHSTPNITKVLVPIDFSEYSDLALDFAELLDQKNDIDRFFMLHIYHDTPSYNILKTYRQMVESMQQNAEDAYHQYIQKKDPKIAQEKLKPLFTLDERNNPARHIYDKAVENDCNLIIVGSKGQSQAASFFIGSITEKLLKLDKSLPVLVLKKKGENKGLMNALLSEG